MWRVWLSRRQTRAKIGRFRPARALGLLQCMLFSIENQHLSGFGRVRLARVTRAACQQPVMS